MIPPFEKSVCCEWMTGKCTLLGMEMELALFLENEPWNQYVKGQESLLWFLVHSKLQAASCKWNVDWHGTEGS